MPKVSLERDWVSQADFARLCGTDPRTIRLHIQKKTLATGESGKLELGPSLRAYLKARKRDRRYVRAPA
jgi:hypothetical protein